MLNTNQNTGATFKLKTVKEWMAGPTETKPRTPLEFIDPKPLDLYDRNRADFLRLIDDIMNEK